MDKAFRDQSLGEAIQTGIKNGGIEDMLFIFDEDGYVTVTDKMAWNYNEDQDIWTDEQGNTMQERWANGVYNDMIEMYKFKGDIKIYGFINPMSGIDEQGDTMQQAWGNGITTIVTQNKITQRVDYKFKGDIKIYGSEFGTSGIHEICTVSMKTEKPDTPDVDTIEEVNNPEQG